MQIVAGSFDGTEISFLYFPCFFFFYAWFIFFFLPFSTQSADRRTDRYIARTQGYV